MKQRALVIDIDYRKKTRSLDFLDELLSTKYELDNRYIPTDETGIQELLSSINPADYHCLVCCQIMLPNTALLALRPIRHKVFFPMYDGAPSHYKIEKWLPYRDFNIICFSKRLYKNLRTIGLSAHYIQYFLPPVSPGSISGKEDSVFYWYRRSDINIDLVHHLLEHSNIAHIHIHNAPDPGEPGFKEPQNTCFDYSMTRWLSNSNDLKNIIDESAIYIAPRLREGIGLSFLESMAKGKCVIAPDNSTMNEYIVHGKTGFLYDPKKPKPLNISGVTTIQKNTISYMEQGYAKWKNEKYRIFDWITMKVNIKWHKIILYSFFRILKNPFKFLAVFNG